MALTFVRFIVHKCAHTSLLERKDGLAGKEESEAGWGTTVESQGCIVKLSPPLALLVITPICRLVGFWLRRMASQHA